jgi:hypothetical protein
MAEGPMRQSETPIKRTVKGTIELIDVAFADQIDIVENGEARRVSVFEAILTQLWFKRYPATSARRPCD